MKKIYPFAFFILFLLCSGKESLSQALTMMMKDTIAYGTPGSDIECNPGDTLYNTTGTSLLIDAVRTQDVSTAGWTTAFCLTYCYAPAIDSVRFSLPANAHQSFILHFYTSTAPDTGKVYFKFKNVNAPSNTLYCRYTGITENGYGIHENSSLASVNVYPSPVISGNDFSLQISHVKNSSSEILLNLFDVYGNRVYNVRVWQGINFMNLNLPAGVYAYTLISGGENITSGKLSVTR